MPKIPKLTNRGPAGLYSKLPEQSSQNGEDNSSSGIQKGKNEEERKKAFVARLLAKHPDAAQSKISEKLLLLAVAVDSLVPDPMNARIHPERNMEAIMESLASFGQMSTITVRRQNMTVMKGNGTLEAAKRLGWTHIAANVIDMTDQTAIGYAIADNRTAELARWDFKTMAVLSELLLESEHSAIGWSKAELTVLRNEFFVPLQESEDQSQSLTERWAIMVSCKGEAEQLKTLTNLTELGYDCRVLTW
jgi:putative heme iron utilization protein